MYISNSEVNMASNTKYQASTVVANKRSIQPAIGNGNVFLVKGNTDDSKNDGTSSNKTSNNFLSSFNYCLNKKGGAEEVGKASGENPFSEANRKVKLSTLNYLLMLLFGERINGGKGDLLSEVLEEAFNMTNTFLVTDESTYTYSETQAVSYSAEGTVVTSDGRELTFNYSFSMSSSFSETYSEKCTSIQTRDMIDPLVIKLDNAPMEIPDQKFYFDLDCDGEEEEISKAMKGAGYLALDLNGDGVINNGRELFGPSTGNGFKELAQYDEDGNGWIDENDSIFEKLRIWTMDENGKAELYGLKKSDVGAIYLGKVNTNFYSYNNEHIAQGAIRETGVFLRESNGSAGAIMHIDLAT